jgi:hypothetical protein
MPLRQRQDTIASTPCGSSSMQKEGNTYLSTTACILLDLWSNTHCSWSGMPLTASAPNALSPFLPTLIEALERQEHLHFSDECRSQLLSMSAATADGRLAFAAQSGSARPLHHMSGNIAHATDPDPHVQRVE